MPNKRVYYGGQAVIEGVMIRGPKTLAIACRRPDGGIATRQETLGSVYSGGLRRIPFIRGVIVLWETLALGMRALMWSSSVQLGEEDQEPGGSMWVMVVGSLVIVGGIFFAGPLILADLLHDLLGSDIAVVAVEGLIRLGVIVGYVAAIGLMPDIRRVYQYHGAEHKSIHALEAGDPLEPEYVQRHPTAHVRCGTSFLLTVVVVSVFVFAAVGNPDLWLRVVSRIVLIPAIASIAYEMIRLGGTFASNPITKVLMWPNLALQSITTKPPDDDQVEVALRALKDMLAAEERAEQATTPVASDSEAAPAVD
ncbi:MAG: DUF1385 domain-containing protein [Chloroflexi bacterium]|nr:DUF1385 domain-containing protein [Chloroflexota bacterium]MCI0783835.1 DUF1385 domain-containing protein [Chloroflexota bacterium]MCI0815290.1 DUF1385 domain-containing protein [Chloroflexota bacterium]MCI0816774.1 DUF1385 domain-containing protein [Chloroflexota bacterium]MCI0818730.1 DUF1385 domain-containing protein [Chloroflexota bacterium]